MTRAELGAALDRSPEAVALLEKGERKISAYELAMVAEALDVRVRELLEVPGPQVQIRLCPNIPG